MHCGSWQLCSVWGQPDNAQNSQSDFYKWGPTITYCSVSLKLFQNYWSCQRPWPLGSRSGFAICCGPQWHLVYLPRDETYPCFFVGRARGVLQCLGSQSHSTATCKTWFWAQIGRRIKVNDAFQGSQTQQCTKKDECESAESACHVYSEVCTTMFNWAYSLVSGNLYRHITPPIHTFKCGCEPRLHIKWTVWMCTHVHQCSYSNVFLYNRQENMSQHNFGLELKIFREG